MECNKQKQLLLLRHVTTGLQMVYAMVNTGVQVAQGNPSSKPCSPDIIMQFAFMNIYLRHAVSGSVLKNNNKNGNYGQARCLARRFPVVELAKCCTMYCLRLWLRLPFQRMTRQVPPLATCYIQHHHTVTKGMHALLCSLSLGATRPLARHESAGRYS